MAEIIVFNLAYVLYVASGFVKTMLRLRIALILVSFAYIVWGLVGGHPSAVLWNIAFGSLHGYQLFKLWVERRRVTLTPEESAIHQRLFGDLGLTDFFTLWSVGEARTYEPGTRLIEQDNVQRSVMLIVDGEVRVERDGTPLAVLGPDDLIGERSYITGDRASASVVTSTETMLHQWDQRKMAALVELCPAAHESMVKYIGIDLAKKL